MMLQLNKLDRMGFVGESIELNTDDIYAVRKNLHMGEFSNVKTECAIVLMKDGTKHRVSKTRKQIIEMGMRPNVLT